MRIGETVYLTRLMVEEHLDTVLIKVCDQGVGVPLAARAHRFEPFYHG